MTEGERLAMAAAQHVGVPFKLHGRDPSYGLDCIGLVAASLEAIGRKPAVPQGYRLRNTSINRWLYDAKKSGFIETSGTIRAGDILLVRPGPAQHHLIIAVSGTEAIHAHAGLRRVVSSPLANELLIAKHWRLIVPNKET